MTEFLNLSSMLSLIYFQVAYDPEKMENGGIYCPNHKDYLVLSEFLE